MTILGAVDYEITKQVLAALEAHGVRYVVFGAVALNLHGLPGATEDLDIFIAPDLQAASDSGSAPSLSQRECSSGAIT